MGKPHASAKPAEDPRQFDCGGLGGNRPFRRKAPLICCHCANPTPGRFHAFTRSPTKHTDERLTTSDIPISISQTKPNFLGHRFSGAAFGWSSFFTFVSRRSLELRLAPPVNPACAALRGAYPKTAPCSLPRPSGLRFAPEIDSASLRSFHRQL